MALAAHNYSEPTVVRPDSFPMRLYEKAKRLGVWNPAEIDFSQDRVDWETMEGERRIVTILFCDVKGSTAMAGQLDPEEWVELMNEAFQYLIAPIYRYEGIVARLMGDALLAFFDHAVDQRLLRAEHRAALLAEAEPAALLDALGRTSAPTLPKWQ